jgi:hypothetical protein
MATAAYAPGKLSVLRQSAQVIESRVLRHRIVEAHYVHGCRRRHLWCVEYCVVKTTSTGRQSQTNGREKATGTTTPQTQLYTRISTTRQIFDLQVWKILTSSKPTRETPKRILQRRLITLPTNLYIDHDPQPAESCPKPPNSVLSYIL